MVLTINICTQQFFSSIFGHMVLKCLCDQVAKHIQTLIILTDRPRTCFVPTLQGSSLNFDPVSFDWYINTSWDGYLSESHLYDIYKEQSGFLRKIPAEHQFYSDPFCRLQTQPWCLYATAGRFRGLSEMPPPLFLGIHLADGPCHIAYDKLKPP